MWVDCLELLPVRLVMDLLSSSSVLFFTSLEKERDKVETEVEVEIERRISQIKN